MSGRRRLQAGRSAVVHGCVGPTRTSPAMSERTTLSFQSTTPDRSPSLCREYGACGGDYQLRPASPSRFRRQRGKFRDVSPKARGEPVPPCWHIQRPRFGDDSRSGHLRPGAPDIVCRKARPAVGRSGGLEEAVESGARGATVREWVGAGGLRTFVSAHSRAYDAPAAQAPEGLAAPDRWQRTNAATRPIPRPGVRCASPRPQSALLTGTPVRTAPARASGRRY